MEYNGELLKVLRVVMNDYELLKKYIKLLKVGLWNNFGKIMINAY